MTGPIFTFQFYQLISRYPVPENAVYRFAQALNPRRICSYFCVFWSADLRVTKIITPITLLFLNILLIYDNM